jgi:hypothetical protein
LTGGEGWGKFPQNRGDRGLQGASEANGEPEHSLALSLPTKRRDKVWRRSVADQAWRQSAGIKCKREALNPMFRDLRVFRGSLQRSTIKLIRVHSSALAVPIICASVPLCLRERKPAVFDEGDKVADKARDKAWDFLNPEPCPLTTPSHPPSRPAGRSGAGGRGR